MFVAPTAHFVVAAVAVVFILNASGMQRAMEDTAKDNVRHNPVTRLRIMSESMVIMHNEIVFKRCEKPLYSLSSPFLGCLRWINEIPN